MSNRFLSLSRFRSAVLALALPLAASTATSQTLLNNLDNTTSGEVILDTPGASLAQALDNDALAVNLKTVFLRLRGVTGPASARVKLWTGVGTEPTDLVEDLGVISAIDGPDAQNYAIDSTLQPVLFSNSRYWISVTNESGEFTWVSTTDEAVSGIIALPDAQASSSDGETGWTPTGAPDVKQMLGASPVVEPFLVTNNAAEGTGSLRWAAGNADSLSASVKITFAPSLSGQTINFLGEHIVLDGDATFDASDLPDGLILSGNANANGTLDAGESRLFVISASSTVIMRSIQFINGQVDNDDNLTGPSTWGGAIVNEGELTLEDCQFTNCRSGFGGAIRNQGTLTLERCRILNCRSGRGGAIFSLGSLTLTDCVLTGNLAQYPIGSDEISEGGGIYNEGTAVLTRVSITDSSARFAGGIQNTATGNLTLHQCTIANNSAHFSGGGVYTSGTASLLHTTIAKNTITTTTAQGGGIYNDNDATLHVSYSIVAGNKRDPLATNTNNDLRGDYTVPVGSANLVTQHLGTRTGSAPLTGDPLFSPLGIYGAPFPILALLPGSPAINAASGSTITSDQRGFSIFGTPDLGAFEADPVVDASFGTLAFDASPISILEEIGTAQIRVLRSGGALGTVSVTVNSAFDTATDEDFTPVTNLVLTFDHGETEKFVPVTVVSDPELREPNENFTLTLSNPVGGAVLGSPNPGVVRIIDFHDRSNPSLTVLTPVNNIIIQEIDGPVVNITGSAKDNMGVEKVEVAFNNGAFMPATLTHAPDYLNCEFALPLTVPPGRHNVLVRATDTRGRTSSSIRRFFTYRVIRELAVAVNGAGKVTNGFSPASQRFVGIPYSITASANSGSVFDGWTANDFTGTGVTPAATELPRLPFVMQEGLELTANFITNPFVPEIIGRFNGLVLADMSTTAASANTGLFTASVTSRGGFSARLTMDGLTHTLSGVFTNQGAVRFGKLRFPTQIIARKNKPTLEVQLELDMNAADPVITGTVTQKAAGGLVVAVSEITAKRAHYNATTSKVDASIAGAKQQRYNLILPAKAQPAPLDDPAKFAQGTGIGSMILRVNGAASFAFHLADNTKFTFSTALSKDDDCPVFAQLYKKLGCFAGLVSIDLAQPNTDATADDCLWFRPVQISNQWYPQGWPGGVFIDLFASQFNVPVGESVLPGLGAEDPLNGNAELTFTGGLLNPSDLTKFLNITPANAVANAPTTDKSYTARLTRNTGGWKGVFTHTDTKKPAWQATTFQKPGIHQGAWGFFMSVAPRPVNGQGQSGQVTLLPQ